jgi:DNA-binding beta-propeller fold protein YncE
MRRFLLLLVPMLLLAQVEVEAVVHLPSLITNGHFIPELNKLYVLGWYEHYALDCSTYQVRARIPRSYDNSYGYYSRDWRRQKLYVGFNPAPDSLVVIDASADTLIRTLPIPGAQAYVATTDRLYVESGEWLYKLDCAGDSVIRRIQVPVPGYIYCSTPCWDSVGGKLYLALSHWGGPALLAAYDCGTDSLLALIDLGTAFSAWWVNLDPCCRKAYYAPDGGRVGVIDARYDTIIRTFPVGCGLGMFNQVAVNTAEHKVYVPYSSTSTAETIYVIDTATDSIVKKLAGPGSQWPLQLARWVPWSNRVYLTRPTAPYGESLGMVVVDCNTDSIIASDLVLGNWPPFDFQIDPIRERVFAIGCESTSVHVLRDTGYGIAEPPAARQRPVPELQVRKTPGGWELQYSIASPCRVCLSVYDLMGREVKPLVNGQLPVGEHRVLWDCRDTNGALVPRGVYFVRLDTPSLTDTKKAVVTR